MIEERCQMSEDRGQKIEDRDEVVLGEVSADAGIGCVDIKPCFLSSALCLLPSALCLLIAAPLFAQNAALPAVPIDGESFIGSLAEVDSDWRLTFDADGKRIKMPAADLLRWGRCAEIKRGPVVVFKDGGLLCAYVAEFDGRSFTVESPTFAAVRLPADMVAGVVFELSVDVHSADAILDWAAGRTGSDCEKDRVRLSNGDELAGRITSIGENSVKIETELTPLTVDLARVAAVKWGRKPIGDKRGHHTLAAWVGMKDGSLLLVERMTLHGGTLRVRIAGDDAGDWTSDADRLVFLQPLGPRVTYLSDLTAADYRCLPYLELPWAYSTDRNAAGGRLRCHGRLFVKGLGVHSSARLTYQLGRRFARFEAGGGIDDTAGGAGSVRFRVYVDGKKKYAGSIVRGGDSPSPISVDIRDAQRLDLIVDFGDRADQQDYADWLDARLISTE